jgi:transcriptional regulator with PAS, ATPase and Fis domain
METVMENWMDSFGASITVADRDLVVVYMNDRAAATFEKSGGKNLIGKKLADCHQEHSMAITRLIMETGEPHSYTIEKAGVRKLIHPAPWEKDGRTAGLVEISFEIPWEMEHFVRG